MFGRKRAARKAGSWFGSGRRYNPRFENMGPRGTPIKDLGIRVQTGSSSGATSMKIGAHRRARNHWSNASTGRRVAYGAAGVFGGSALLGGRSSGGRGRPPSHSSGGMM